MCDRKNCDNSAVYRIPKIGGICHSCRNEFLREYASTPMTDEKITEVLDLFMGMEGEHQPIIWENVPYFTRHIIVD